jgi:hypothetical protein
VITEDMLKDEAMKMVKGVNLESVEEWAWAAGEVYVLYISLSNSGVSILTFNIQCSCAIGRASNYGSLHGWNGCARGDQDDHATVCASKRLLCRRSD